MALIRTDDGREFALMECPHCETYEMHPPTDGRDGTFECATCFAMFRHVD